MQAQEKVTPLRHEEKTEDNKQQFAKDIIANSRKDMGKVAMIISILCVLLLVVFFFGLNQNISGLSAKVEELSSLKGDVQSLDSKVLSMEQKIATLENLPQMTKNMLLSNILQEMSQKAAYLSSQVSTEEQSEKLMQAKELLQQVQAELGSAQ